MTTDQRPPATEPRLAFVLALNGRSGTNYLINLLKQHPAIAAAAAPFWEDFLLHESHHLQAFVDGVFTHWQRVAGDQASPALKGSLEQDFGIALRRFISRDVKDPVLVLKTPSIRNIANIQRLFPQEKLIILLRDGRDLLASGMTSFGWALESAADAWAKAADELLRFCDQHPKTDRLIVRYEDLVTDVQPVLASIFTHLDIDPDLYDWGNNALTQVVGSSDLKKAGGDLHWTPIDKPTTFKPLGRWHAWSNEQKAQFETRAGAQLRALQDLV